MSERGLLPVEEAKRKHGLRMRLAMHEIERIHWQHTAKAIAGKKIAVTQVRFMTYELSALASYDESAVMRASQDSD